MTTGHIDLSQSTPNVLILRTRALEPQHGCGHLGADPTGLDRRGPGAGRVALPDPASARTLRLDPPSLGCFSEQWACEVLLTDPNAANCTPRSPPGIRWAAAVRQVLNMA